MAIIAPAAIAENGWQFFTKCRCDGILKWKYRHPGKPNLELHWWVGYYQFKVMNQNTTKIPLTKISKLDEILKSL